MREGYRISRDPANGFAFNRKKSRVSPRLSEFSVAMRAADVRFRPTLGLRVYVFSCVFPNRRDDGMWSLAFLTLAFLLVSCFSSAQTEPAATPEVGTGIEGVITVGPTHGGPARVGVPDSKPLANATFIVENEKGVVTTFVTDDQGRFRISLTPGHYTVSARDKKPKIGRYGPFDVDVVAGQMTKVGWYCDSGMR